MFITLPPFEFRMPAGLVDQDARRWRMMQLSLHVPWFLLSVEVIDPGSKVGRVQTLCFAWADDLMTYLPSVDPAIVKGLVCMAPGWTSANSTWTSHDVREVWQADSADGRYYTLLGADGQTLDVGLVVAPSEERARRTLLLRVNPQRHADRSKSKTAATRRPS